MDTSPELQAGVTRDIYGMPAFISLTVPDVRGTADWFTRTLDFIELFAMPPGDHPVLIHLRRWRYQDVLIRQGDAGPHGIGDGIQLSLAADFDELDALAAKARAAGTDVEGPSDTAWNTRDLTVLAPTGLRLVFTARRPESLQDQAFNANMTRWNAQQRSADD